MLEGGVICKILPRSLVSRLDPKHQREPHAPNSEKRPPLFPFSKIGQGAKGILGKGDLPDIFLKLALACSRIWIEARGTQTTAGQSEGVIHSVSTLGCVWLLGVISCGGVWQAFSQQS